MRYDHQILIYRVVDLYTLLSSSFAFVKLYDERSSKSDEVLDKTLMVPVNLSAGKQSRAPYNHGIELEQVLAC